MAGDELVVEEGVEECAEGLSDNVHGVGSEVCHIRSPVLWVVLLYACSVPRPRGFKTEGGAGVYGMQIVKKLVCYQKQVELFGVHLPIPEVFLNR